MTSSSTVAEEVIQEVFVALLRHGDRYKPSDFSSDVLARKIGEVQQSAAEQGGKSLAAGNSG